MAWSIFSNGGGNGAALTWAKDLLSADGAPDTPGNEQFIYDWEESEGGGGKYNPLNQGPVPGHPELTTTGSQYGGGAADYASYAAGIQGAVDYLNMPNYTAVQAALKANDPVQARNALIQSPWAASHYGYGSSFSNAPLPGSASSLLGDSSTVNPASSTTGTVQSTSLWGNIWNYLNGTDTSKLYNLLGGLFGGGGPNSAQIGTDIMGFLVRGALILFGAILIIVGSLKLTGSEKTVTEVVTMPAQGVKKAAKKVSG